MEFPLFRLPWLAQDEVLKSFDPMAIISLSWKFKKLKLRLDRFVKDQKFGLKYMYDDSFQYDIRFNIPEKSIEIWESFSKHPENRSKLFIIRGDRTIQVFLEGCLKRLTRDFDPTTIIIHLRSSVHSYDVSEFENPDSYDFQLQEKPKKKVNGRLTMTRCKETAKQTLMEFQERKENRGVSLNVKSADWMTKEDFSIVSKIDTVNIYGMKVSTRALTQFLKKWTRQVGWLRRMKLEISNDSELDFKVVTSELKAKLINSDQLFKWRTADPPLTPPQIKSDRMSAFPLLRLPSLAQDAIIQKMSSFEHFFLFQLSRKLMCIVKRSVRSQAMTLNCFDDVGLENKTIAFGHVQKSLSTINVRKIVGAWQKQGIVYTKDDEIVIYHNNQTEKVLEKVIKRLKEMFDPISLTSMLDSKSISFSLFRTFFGLDAFKFVLHKSCPDDERNTVDILIMSTSKSFSKRTFEEVKRGSSQPIYLKCARADWMTLDDLNLVTKAQKVELSALRITSRELNVLLKRWDARTSFTKEMALEHQSHWNLQDVLEGLRVEPMDNGSKHLIRNNFGIRAVISCAGNIFHVKRVH